MFLLCAIKTILSKHEYQMSVKNVLNSYSMASYWTMIFSSKTSYFFHWHDDLLNFPNQISIKNALEKKVCMQNTLIRY